MKLKNNSIKKAHTIPTTTDALCCWNGGKMEHDVKAKFSNQNTFHTKILNNNTDKIESNE